MHEVQSAAGRAARRLAHGGAEMADLAYVALALVFFWLTWWLVDLCERL